MIAGLRGRKRPRSAATTALQRVPTAKEESAVSHYFVRSVLVAVALLSLAGCASDPRYKEGASWVVSQEQERQRLQAMGFPQYSCD